MHSTSAGQRGTGEGWQSCKMWSTWNQVCMQPLFSPLTRHLAPFISLLWNINWLKSIKLRLFSKFWGETFENHDTSKFFIKVNTLKKKKKRFKKKWLTECLILGAQQPFASDVSKSISVAGAPFCAALEVSTRLDSLTLGWNSISSSKKWS